MFAYLKGILAYKANDHLILEVNHIGYILMIPAQLNEQLPSIGEWITVYTSFIVREFSHTLYGFLNKNEKDIFEVLVNITGVGPKLALSLIGHLSLAALQQAVLMQDLRTLCQVPGVGKKTAERLMVELKDKLGHFIPIETPDLGLSDSFNSSQVVLQDAVLALIQLGYTQAVAYKAVRQSINELDEEFDLTRLITVSLKNV